MRLIKMSVKKTTIEIPDDLYEELQKQVEESKEHQTVNDFIIYLLSQFLGIEDTKGQSEEEKEEIEKRLKKLGYL